RQTVVPYRLPLSWSIPAPRPSIDRHSLPNSQMGPFQNTNDAFHTHECLDRTCLVPLCLTSRLYISQSTEL
ncbi:hypothetical protein EJ06DRAFT_534737, partial [Trichodelitschia bisporula]